MPAATGKTHGSRRNNGKAQSNTKATPAAAAAAAAAVLPNADPALPRPTLSEPTPTLLQQALLDSFTTAFPAELNQSTIELVLQPLLQQVKHHLYERDFKTAFSRPEWLRAYAARWSASRALGYIDVFRDILPLVSSSSEAPYLRISCLGGGAGAEVAALAAWLAHSLATDGTALSVTAFDMADWSTVLCDLHKSLLSVPELAGITEQDLSIESVTADVLDTQFLGSGKSTTKGIASSSVVTLMFTLNELYSTSISKTQKLLLDLTRTMSADSLLLVVDSPGSYSTVGLGGTSQTGESGANGAQKQRKYPMSWLLDHALLETARGLERDAKGGQAEGPWEKVEAVESRWFRLREGLRYPVQLENMRYQLHLYRRRRG